MTPPTASPSREAAEDTAPRRLPPWIAVALLLIAGVVVYLPALRSPFLLDDYLHQSMVDGTFPAHRDRFDLYNFVNDADRSLLLERGMLPWWSHPKLRVRFLRPLSSAMLWEDHLLFGDHPLVMHLHSFLWWALVVIAARRLFKRLLSPRVARIATVIFALAPCHALPIAWLANRESLVSLTFCILGLGAHLSWREGRGIGYAVLASALFTIAMLGGEYALCFAGYILAIEITARNRVFADRCFGVMPFGLPAFAYLLVRAKLHYGTIGSGFYADPLSEPLAFLHVAPRRLATLILDGWFSLDTETLTSSTSPWLLAAGLAMGIALFLAPMRRAFASIEGKERDAARWLLLGSFLALAPVLAVVPSPRVLGASHLGLATAVALVLDLAWFRGSKASESSPDRGTEFTGSVALLLGFAHLVHGPATAWLVGREFEISALEFREHAVDLRSRIPDLKSAEIVLVRGMGASFFIPFALDPHGSQPARWRILAHTGHVLTLRRGPRTLDLVVPKDHSLFPIGQGNLFRSGESVMHKGDVFPLAGVRVTVLEIGTTGGPRAVRFEFDQDLESSELQWIAEKYGGGFPEARVPFLGNGQPFDP